MKLTRIIAIAVIAASFGVGSGMGQAQQLSRVEAPAEFPPSSYKGKQYVDSRGCVFIRAGIDGNVTWVPRVARDRKMVCGFQPTLGGTQVAEAELTPAPETPPKQITPAPAAKPAATPARVAAPKPVKRKVASPAPVRARTPVPKPAVAPAPPVIAAVPARRSACPAASPLSQRYINSGREHPVRCGPQDASIIGARTAAAPGAPATGSSARAATTGGRVMPGGIVIADTAPVDGFVAVTGGMKSGTRIVPKHVYQNRINTRNGPIPKGYQPAWEDDRLNPRRAEQTLTGHFRSQLVWTETVPRRLINGTNGRDVTAQVPLVYPYTDVMTQRRELGEVTLGRRDGRLVKRIVRNPGSRAPVYSSRSATAPNPPAAKARAEVRPAGQAVAAGAGRYVQVGTFGQVANAQATARRMQALGLPVRMGQYTRSGKSYRIVLAGPFATDGDIRTALGRVRGAGFGDAFVRR